MMRCHPTISLDFHSFLPLELPMTGRERAWFTGTHVRGSSKTILATESHQAPIKMSALLPWAWLNRSHEDLREMIPHARPGLNLTFQVRC